MIRILGALMLTVVVLSISRGHGEKARWSEMAPCPVELVRSGSGKPNPFNYQTQQCGNYPNATGASL